MTPPAQEPATRQPRCDGQRRTAHSRRAFLAFVAAAALRPRTALGQSRRPTRVVLYTVGDEPSGLFRRSLRDALHGLTVTLTIEEADSVEAIHRHHSGSLCLVVTQDEDAAQVMRVEDDGSQHLLRRVPLRGRLDAAARAAIGHVVRSAVESAVRLAPR